MGKFIKTAARLYRLIGITKFFVVLLQVGCAHSDETTASTPKSEIKNAEGSKKIAITIDDLPGWAPVRKGIANETLSSLATTLISEKVSATGFVIGSLGSQSNDSRRALESWAKAGLSLGNHSWDHKDYNKSSPQEFWDGVRRTEGLLKPLREKYGPWPITFQSVGEHFFAQMEQVLGRNSFRVQIDHHIRILGNTGSRS